MVAHGVAAVGGSGDSAVRRPCVLTGDSHPSGRHNASTEHSVGSLTHLLQSSACGCFHGPPFSAHSRTSDALVATLRCRRVSHSATTFPRALPCEPIGDRSSGIGHRRCIQHTGWNIGDTLANAGARHVPTICGSQPTCANRCRPWSARRAVTVVDRMHWERTSAPALCPCRAGRCFTPGSIGGGRLKRIRKLN